MKSTELSPNHRILIIDDNESIHADFRNVICPDESDVQATNEMEAILFNEDPPAPARIQFELDSAYQGQQGLELVKKALAEGRPYAMAFVDVRMPPGWDGVETIARIWEVDPKLQIVVCTAYADYSWAEMRAKVGQPDNLLVLKKPFDNIEVQQLAHALTKKWLLDLQTRTQMAELASANELLAISQERFSAAFHQSPLLSGILCMEDLRFVDVNQLLAQLSGHKREEIIGRTPIELSLWQKPEMVHQWRETLLRGEPVLDQEAQLCNQSGGVRETLVSLSLLRLGGQAHMLLLAQDVSERALLERQLRQAQKMDAIGQLAAGVAHDFNNILTIILCHAGLLEHQPDASGTPSKSVKVILNASTRAASLIRQLLMFSRKQVTQFRHLDLNEALGNAIKMLERLVGEHVQLDFRAHPALPAINADSSMLEQIVMNLAVNARDALPNGGKVSIVTSLETVHGEPTALHPERRPGEYVCLLFQDNGIGMDAEVVSRIFEPFFTTKPAGKGTGLGLSTVYGIVRQHHGWLEVESKPNQGTAFRIYFPASRQAVEKVEIVEDAGLCRGRETLLVAEDDDALRQMVVLVLKIQGYNVLEAASGPQALEVWRQASRPVDLLLTDMVMPAGMMGRDLAARLTAQNPRLKVIYTSGYSSYMAGQDVSLLEGRNFLPKPYSLGKLAQFVRECLDHPNGESARPSNGGAGQHSSPSSGGRAFLPGQTGAVMNSANG
jgi:two-component system, cell cycle sensor histidine kinase and response regulator CckA